MAQTERLLTTGEAAAYLHMSANTIRRWCDDGRLRYVRLPSNQRRFAKRDLDAALTVHEPIPA